MQMLNLDLYKEKYQDKSLKELLEKRKELIKNIKYHEKIIKKGRVPLLYKFIDTIPIFDREQMVKTERQYLQIIDELIRDINNKGE